MSEFNNKKEVKTRKEHQCLGCLGKFPPGTQMVNNKGLFEDHFYNYYLCYPCEKFLNKHSDLFEDGLWDNCVNETKEVMAVEG